MRKVLLVLPAALALGLAAVPALAQAASASAPAIQQACPTAVTGHAQCLSEHVTAATAPSAWSATGIPEDYGPADLQSAYALATASAARGGGETVAIVDAGGQPNIVHDLNSYRAYYHLPKLKAGQFRQYDEEGTVITTPEPVDPGWTDEISLDVDMVSAICPNCDIALMEADSNSFADLSTAVNSAAGLPHVVAISNSYGGTEFSGEADYNSFYDHAGIATTASAGDGGYGTLFPAADPDVVSVGGTHLLPAGNARGWTETVWGPSNGEAWGTGSGCSLYEPKPSWQHDSGCANRTMNDTSAVADPFTGVCIWDTYDSGNAPYCGWGGTSLSSPVVAAAYALAGRPAHSPAAPSYSYKNTGELHDVTSGSNLLSGSCSPAYLCHGRVGYDGPTGFGTPYGTGAYSYNQVGYVSAARLGNRVASDGGSHANGHALTAAAPGTSASEQFQADIHGSYITIREANHTGTCLETAGTGSNSKIELHACNGSANEEWRQLSNGQLEAVHATAVHGSPMVWTDPGNGGSGTVLRITPAAGSAAQEWSAP